MGLKETQVSKINIVLPLTVFTKFFNHIQGDILAETEFHTFQTNMTIISQ